MILVTASTAGNPSVQVSIPSDDADENPFVFTLNWTLAATGHALYTTSGAFSSLISSTFPGVAVTATVNGTVTTGSGVSQYFHLLDRALFLCQLASPGITDLFLKGLGAALPAAPANLTSTLTNAAGFFGQILFAAGDDIVFTYNAGGGAPTRLFSMTINGAAAGAPLEISGAIPGGSPAGVQAFVVSPRRDQVAFLGDFATAGIPEVFLAPFAGGSRTPLSAALAGGRAIVANSIRWMPDQSGLVYETAIAGQQRELNLVRLGPPVTVTRLNGAVLAGRTGVIADRTRLSNTGTQVLFVSDEASGTGQREVYVVSLIGGAVSPMAGLNGVAVPGVAGVADCGINHAGTLALFTADSGTANRPELWLSLIAGTTPTTTKIVMSTTNVGVEFDGARGVVSGTVAWFTRDDQANARQELFLADLSVPVPAFTRIVNTGTFPGGTGTSLGSIFPQPDGRVVFGSNQGGSTKVFSALLSATPGTVNLSTLRTTTGLITVQGNGVAFEGDNGAAPQEVFFNLAAGGAEVQIDGAEIGGASSGVYSLKFYSSGRVFYQFFTATFDQLWSANTAPVIARNRIDTAGVANGGSLRLGNEPR